MYQGRWLLSRWLYGLMIASLCIPYRHVHAAVNLSAYPGTLHQMKVVAHQAQIYQLLRPQHLSVNDKLQLVTTEYPREVTLQYDEFILRESTEPFKFQLHHVQKKANVKLAHQLHGTWYTLKTVDGNQHVLMTKVRNLYIEIIPNVVDGRWSASTVSNIVGSLAAINFPK